MVVDDRLSLQERKILLNIARQTLEAAVKGNALPPLNLAELPEKLRAKGATFVTLTIEGRLRGCIGALEPYLPLAEDVREHASAAALQDYRFPPVTPKELPEIEVEISRLSRPELLDYTNAEDLLQKLRPGIDGVVLADGLHRATFLPQVWEKIPDKKQFLSQLCLKMGAPPDLWRKKKIEVRTYQVEEFSDMSIASLSADDDRS